MTAPFILKRSPIGPNLEDYDVLENGAVVGRIFFLDAVGPQGRPWMWASGHNGEGAQAGDLPMQAPTHYHIAFILKTARALGLDMPPMLLARARAASRSALRRV